jgi:hypothetical protein
MEPPMNVLDDNFVFLHIPKSGGTSVTELLFALMGPVYPRDKLFGYPEFSEIDPPGNPSLFISHFGYNFYRGSGGYCMTVMRDPVERILSLFSYWKNPGNKMPPGDPLPDDMTLEEFLASDRQDIWTNVRNAQTWQIAFGLDVKTRHRLGGIKAFELYDLERYNQSQERTKSQDVSPETLGVIRGMTELDAKLYQYASESSRLRSNSARATSAAYEESADIR